MEYMRKLVHEKDVIESKIKALSEVLVINNNIGMDDPLIDSEGFPRADIDVYQVRHARCDIIYLQNDYKALMKQIENELVYIHKNPQFSFDPNGTNASVHLSDMNSFAVINRVDATSPAEADGLREGDQICKFGSVSSENFKGLESVGEVVKNSRNKPVQVIFRRDGKEKFVNLTPRTWSGRGLLGCNIVPLDNIER